MIEVNKNHPATQPMAYGIKQAVETSGLSRTFIYNEIAEGRLRTFKVGSRTLIAAADLSAWLEGYRSHAA